MTFILMLVVCVSLIAHTSFLDNKAYSSTGAIPSFVMIWVIFLSTVIYLIAEHREHQISDAVKENTQHGFLAIVTMTLAILGIELLGSFASNKPDDQKILGMGIMAAMVILYLNWG